MSIDLAKLKFDSSFVFGAATSAYQIEGATSFQKYGRGESIWDTYFKERCHLDNGEIGSGHYELMDQDVELMSSLGLRAYRFSIAWPRVQPLGYGPVNMKGLDFYDRLVDKLLSANIVPYLTLYHWDLPQGLEDLGGWTNRNIADYFADYAAILVKKLGDRVKNWGTINEPEVIVAGYIGTGLAPGRNSYNLRMHVAHNLLRAHGTATKLLKSEYQDLKVGIVLNLVPIDPLNDSAKDAANKRWLRDYAFYLEALFKGTYPDFIFDEILKTRVNIQPGDLAVISTPTDYIGVNWYLRMVVDNQDKLIEIPDVERTLMGWEVRPASLTTTLVDINRDYNLPPIYITENGAAVKDEILDSEIKDLNRLNYIANHLYALKEAIDNGVDVRGYFVWSLLDNLEWSLGYSKTFGIVHVDRDTLKRTPKSSALWYRDLIRSQL